jgi:hypothetical protein
MLLAAITVQGWNDGAVVQWMHSESPCETVQLRVIYTANETRSPIRYQLWNITALMIAIHNWQMLNQVRFSYQMNQLSRFSIIALHCIALNRIEFQIVAKYQVQIVIVIQTLINAFRWEYSGSSKFGKPLNRTSSCSGAILPKGHW